MRAAAKGERETAQRTRWQRSRMKLARFPASGEGEKRRSPRGFGAESEVKLPRRRRVAACVGKRRFRRLDGQGAGAAQVAGTALLAAALRICRASSARMMPVAVCVTCIAVAVHHISRGRELTRECRRLRPRLQRKAHECHAQHEGSQHARQDNRRCQRPVDLDQSRRSAPLRDYGAVAFSKRRTACNILGNQRAVEQSGGSNR
jgi:hypothetical protein